MVAMKGWRFKRLRVVEGNRQYLTGHITVTKTSVR
jgi:hypothetical protein